MKVLIITGRLMEKRVREIAKKYGFNVFAAPVDIASFVKMEHLPDVREYDLVLFPGYSRLDLENAENSLGIKTARGPKDVANLDLVLKNIESIELSKTVPACDLLTEKRREIALGEIGKIDAENVKGNILKKPGNFCIGSLAVGRDFPMRVVAEIVDADKMKDSWVLERARYYLEQGADILDIGISEKAPSRVRELIALLRELLAPLSIDSMDKDNISAAIESGIDLILSLDNELIKILEPTEIPVVVISGRRQFKSSEEKVKALLENVDLAKKRGFKNLVADPVLEPIGQGLSDSISAYREVGKNGKAPLLMGVGNVTELTDADSIGLNAMLAGIAMECGVCLLFTTEASDKTRGSVRELKTASNMMFLAKNRNTIPKDLGLDLLAHKEKRRAEIPALKIKTRIVSAKPTGHGRDPAGDFSISVDKKILAVHIKEGTPDLSIEGINARDISDTIIRMGLVSTLNHAMYLGRELEKAEMALKTGRGYVQDERLFG